MRVALYARVSTTDQHCDRQVRELTEFAQRADYTVVGIWKETASGADNKRAARAKILQLAQNRKIDGILVTELTRWGRSTIDLITTLEQLAAWKVSVIAQSGMQLDLSTAQGKLIASVLAALAQFERELLRERVKSGLAAAKARGVQLGRKPGNSRKDKLTPKVLELVEQQVSYRDIAKRLKCSKTTVAEIVKENR